MIRETLLDKAKKDIAAAEALYRQPEADELFLDAVSYHIQQAIEKTLKLFIPVKILSLEILRQPVRIAISR